jgi:hypothetical protein
LCPSSSQQPLGGTNFFSYLSSSQQPLD